MHCHLRLRWGPHHHPHMHEFSWSSGGQLPVWQLCDKHHALPSDSRVYACVSARTCLLACCRHTNSHVRAHVQVSADSQVRIHVHMLACDHLRTFAGLSACARVCARLRLHMSFMKRCVRSSAHWHMRNHIGVYMLHTAAAGLTYSCEASTPTGCTATCGYAEHRPTSIRTTTRTCISSAGQAVDSYLCGNCATSTTTCPAIPECMHA